MSTEGKSAASARVGVVAIGRNEGERLRRCLASLVGRASPIVYVDSGSTDGSVAMAAGMGALVVELDTSIPFTAARARNSGLARLRAAAPELELVQFVDGDCVVADGWFETAAAALLGDPTLAVVCGRRRERHPDASIYNRLCDMEWNTPVGYADACGGDALMRIAAVDQVGGYNADLIAGEEPDLCARMRLRGWKVLRIDAEMTLHDAAMTRFGQWWKRSVRAGHAYAEGAALHASEPGRYWVREVRSNWLWGVAVPGCSLGLAVPTFGASLGLFAGHALLGVRVHRWMRRRGFSSPDAGLYAAFCVMGKVPQALGQTIYWTKRLRGVRSGLIEYKGAGDA
jgi:GT2 family glycosyltransferase